MDEKILWSDRKHYLWFPFSFTKYWIKEGRLYTQKGLFTTKSDELLLYRITDISLTRSLTQKIYGTGTLTLTCRADTDKHLQLINIKDSKNVKDLLSKIVEESRDSKRVSGKEFYGGNIEISEMDTESDNI